MIRLMIKRIFKRILAAIKQEIEWLKFRIWLKSRATKYTA